MRRVLRLLFVSLIIISMVSVLGIAYAQEDAQKKAQVPTPAKTIFDFKDELKLSDNQEKEIKKLLVNLNKEEQLKGARLVIVNSELDDMIDKEADLLKIKDKLKEAYGIQAEGHYANIEFTRKFNKVLTAEQLKKWREIQTLGGK